MNLFFQECSEFLDTAKRIFDLGIEKVVIQSAAFSNPKIISDIAKITQTAQKIIDKVGW